MMIKIFSFVKNYVNLDNYYKNNTKKIKDFLKFIKYDSIIDELMQLQFNIELIDDVNNENNNFINALINGLKQKNKNIYEISKYLENKKNKYKNFENAPKIIYLLKDEQFEYENEEEIQNQKKKFYVVT